MRVKRSEKAGLRSHQFMANRWENVETVTAFIFLGSKITSDSDCDEIKVNIMGIEEVDRDVYSFRISYRTTKAELEKSTLLRRLRSQQSN